MNAEARLEEVQADRKAIYESAIELKEQIKLHRFELESERAALSQSREGLEALQRALDESLEREGEATRRAEFLEVKLDGISLVLSFCVCFLTLPFG